MQENNEPVKEEINTTVQEQVVPTAEQNEQGGKPQKQSSKLIGFLGILLGVALGSVIYVIIYCIGFIASLAGIAMTFFAAFFYGKFTGNQMSKGWYVVTGITIVIAIILSSMIGCTLTIVGETQWPFWDTFVHLFDLLDYYNITSSFMGDIVMGLVFGGIGFFSQMKVVKNKS